MQWRRELRLSVYNVLTWEREAFLRAYHRHVEMVLNHFVNRLQELLTLNITAGEGWAPLCAFLQTPVPSVSFPHAHARGNALKRSAGFGTLRYELPTVQA